MGPRPQARAGALHRDPSTGTCPLTPPAHTCSLQGCQCGSTRSWWEPAGGSRASSSPPSRGQSPLAVPSGCCRMQKLLWVLQDPVVTADGGGEGGADRGKTGNLQLGEAVLASPQGFRALSGGAEALGAGEPWPKHHETQGMGSSSGSDALPLQNSPPSGQPPSSFLQWH